MPTVLILDDNATLVRFLTIHLERALPNVEVMSASTCEQAQRLVDDHPPDLLLLDWQLADGTARPILSYAGQQAPDAGVIITSGQAVLPDDLVDATGRVLRFVEKPFELDHLVELVREQLGGMVSLPTAPAQPAAIRETGSPAGRHNGDRGQSGEGTISRHRLANQLTALIAAMRATSADICSELEAGTLDADSVENHTDSLVREVREIWSGFAAKTAGGIS